MPGRLLPKDGTKNPDKLYDLRFLLIWIIVGYAERVEELNIA